MLYELLTTLEQTHSIKEKEALVKSHVGSDEVRRMFHLALHPKVLFNTTKFPAFGMEPMKVLSWNDVLDFIEGISNTQPRGNELLTVLSHLSGVLTGEQHEVARRIILKDLRCNVGETIVNKVWKGLIPEYPYMGAKSDNPKNRAGLKIEKGAVAQEKCDGMFCSCIRNEDYQLWRTRQGNIVNMPLESSLVHEAFSLPDGVWQGELRVYDYDKEAFLPRHIGNGLIKQGLDKGEITLEHEHQEIIFTVWDFTPLEFWTEGEYATPYANRFNYLNSTLAGLEFTSIRVVRSRMVRNWLEANSFYQMILEEGGEGAIVKRLDGKWKDGKPSWQVKMKVEESCDMLVVDTVPHTKKPGYIGALKVISGDTIESGPPLEACCGGLMEEAMMMPPDFWVGKVIRMKYNALSPYGRFDHPRVDNGAPKPQPFACVREPGSKPNTADQIREQYAAATGVK